MNIKLNNKIGVIQMTTKRTIKLSNDEHADLKLRVKQENDLQHKQKSCLAIQTSDCLSAQAAQRLDTTAVWDGSTCSSTAARRH